MLGKYKLSKDLKPLFGVTVFTIRAGKEIKVCRQDKEFSKVLIDFGDGHIHWFHESWLKHYAEKISN